eukprot:375320_1
MISPVQQGVQSKASARDRLLSSENQKSPICVSIAHGIAWICLISTLLLMPIMTYYLLVTLSSLYSYIPCHCYGFKNADDTVISNMGACDCLMTSWKQSPDYINKMWSCFDHSRPKSSWNPQYCEGKYREMFAATTVLTALLFPQYMFCAVAWALVIVHCYA